MRLENQVSRPELQEDDGEDGDEDGGRHGDDAEEGDEPRVQLRARRALAAVEDEAHQPARDHDAQQQQQDEVEVEQKKDGADARPIGRRARDHGIGDDARDDGADRQEQGKPSLEIGATQEAPASRLCQAREGEHVARSMIPRVQKGSDHGLRSTWMSSSRIFFLKVLRLRPSRSAALS